MFSPSPPKALTLLEVIKHAAHFTGHLSGQFLNFLRKWAPYLNIVPS